MHNEALEIINFKLPKEEYHVGKKKMNDESLIEIIEECVRLCEEEYPNDVYSDCVEKMKQVNLENVSEDDVEQIIKRFLYTWGNMGRVLGQKKVKGWKNKLTILIQQKYRELEDFRKKDLAHTELDMFENKIKEYYESFKEILKTTASGKVMHLICPDFFPSWDTGIRKAIADLHGYKNDEDYYKFMQVTQSFLKHYEKVFSNLSDKYGRNKLRILDELFWYHTQHPLWLFKGISAAQEQ